MSSLHRFDSIELDQEFDDKLMYMYTTSNSDQYDIESEEEEAITVVQHLAPEQYLYEFPSKSCLRALAYLDDEQEENSFFDESSFASSTTAYSSALYEEDDWEEEDDQLVEDGRLSPLELPSPKTNPSTATITQSSGCTPVGPSSFLPDIHKDQLYHHVTPRQSTDLEVFCNESIPILDSSSSSSSVKSSSSRIVLIRLNKIDDSCSSTSLTYLASDEGYDDNEDELESQCIFYPLSDDEETEDLDMQDRAAIKIQAAWRGFCSRRQNKQQLACLRADQRVIMNLAYLCGKIHRRQMTSVDNRLAQLEQRLQEETAMRIAFEKAMEDMTVVIDQQQKILYDRLEQEVHMRQVYESKFNAALAQLQPLESRLRKEVNARNKMEEMMTRVLDQMHEAETSRQLHQKEEAESKKLMQSKLDQALEDIAMLKKSKAASRPSLVPSTRPSIAPSARPSIAPSAKNASSTTTKSSRTDSTMRRSIVPAPTTRRQPPRTTTKNLDTSQSKPVGSLIERPSVIPSNRRPLDQSIRRTYK